MNNWQIKREAVYRLYRNGAPIVDGDGRPCDYASEAEAQHVAANWELYRAPMLAELRTMSDQELEERAEGVRRRWGWFR